MSKRRILRGALVTTIIFVGLPLSSYSGIVLSMNRCGANLKKTAEKIQIGNIMRTEVDKSKLSVKKTNGKIVF